MASLASNASGGAITYAAATAGAGGDTAPTGHRIHVKNGGVASTTVTVTGYGPCSHGFLHDMQFTVPAGEDRFINPPDAARYADPATGRVKLTYSVVTSVTVAAIA